MMAAPSALWLPCSPPGGAGDNQSAPPNGGGMPVAETFTNVQDVISWMIVIISIMSLLSNVLVFVLIGLNRMLQTTTNCFVASLSAADLLYSSVMIPNYIANVARSEESACFLDTVFPILCSLASVWSLLAITADRYLAVRLPFRYRLRMGRCGVAAVLVVVWTLSILLTLSLFIPALPDEMIHTLRCAHYFYPTVVFFVFYVIFMLVPLVGNVILYVKIISIARDADKKDRKDTETVSAASSQEPEVPMRTKGRRSSLPGFSRGFSVRVAKSTRLFFTISLIFMGVWLPMIIMTLVYALCDSCRSGEVLCLRKVTELLYAIALLANPWIYTLRTMDFRFALRRLCCSFRCCLKRNPSVGSASISQIS